MCLLLLQCAMLLHCSVTPTNSMECILCRVIDAQYETNWPLCQLHALFDSLHMLFLSFLPTHEKRNTKKTHTKDSKIKEVTKWKTMKNSFENIPNDTQTQIFYILPLSPFACFSTNKWISFFFFSLVSAVSIEFFVTTVSWYWFFLNPSIRSACWLSEKKYSHTTLLWYLRKLVCRRYVCALQHQTQKN